MDVVTATVSASSPAGVAHTLLATLLSALLPLLTAALIWGVKQATAWVTAHTENKKAQDVAMRLGEAISNAVKMVEQSLIESVKNDASLTAGARDAALAAAKTVAVQAAKAALGPKGVALLMVTLGLKTEREVDALIADRIEAAVHDLRVGAGMVGAADVVALAGAKALEGVSTVSPEAMVQVTTPKVTP